MNIEDLLVSDASQRRRYSAEQIIAVLDGGGGGGASRLSQTITYTSHTTTPTVYYTALETDGTTVITARTTSGVSQVGALPMWRYTQAAGGRTDYVVVWDEGDASDYTLEWIVVDE